MTTNTQTNEQPAGERAELLKECALGVAGYYESTWVGDRDDLYRLMDALNNLTGEAQPAPNEPAYYAHRIERALADLPEDASVSLHRDFLREAAYTIRKLLREIASDTTTPAQPAREWVGLTDGERDAIYHNNCQYEDLRAVESLLREKNAGKPAADDKADEAALQRLTQNGAAITQAQEAMK